jgi:hypothetical protein
MKNPFKVKDTVHHIKHGKGLVIEVQTDTVLVAYNDDKSRWHSDLTILSFTPYTLKGFTQERPFEPVVGQMYYFWDNDMIKEKTVIYSELWRIDLCDDFKYLTIQKTPFQHISETNPLL